MKIALLALSFSLTIAGCRNAVESGPPYITGVITARETNGDTSFPRLRVEQDPSDPVVMGRGSPKSEVSWNGDTDLSRSTGGNVSSADLRVGQKVSVWTTGLVLDSYPDQVSATRIVIEKQ